MKVPTNFILALFVTGGLAGAILTPQLGVAQTTELPPFITPLDDAPALSCGQHEDRSFKSTVMAGDIFCWRVGKGSRHHVNVRSENAALRKIKINCNALNGIDLADTYPRLTCNTSCCDKDICLNRTTFEEKINFPLYRKTDFNELGTSCLELISCNKTFVIKYRCGGCGDYSLDELDQLLTAALDYK